jgi:hypothetical protein
MHAVFLIELNEIQPSQLYLSSKKLNNIMENFPSTPNSRMLMPIKKLKTYGCLFIHPITFGKCTHAKLEKNDWSTIAHYNGHLHLPIHNNHLATLANSNARRRRRDRRFFHVTSFSDILSRSNSEQILNWNGEKF